MSTTRLRHLIFATAVLAVGARADSSTLDAAIGGAIGGAAGAAIGNEVGGRDGAIIGGAIGGATGAAVATDGGQRAPTPAPRPSREYSVPQGSHPHEYHCPPGQRKKGRC